MLPAQLHQVPAVVGDGDQAMAENGRELVNECKVHRPDLVITDIKMPDMDGIDAAAAVNREHQVPVVLVSGHTDGELLARSGAEYIMSYLVKPVKPADLQAAITLAVARFEQLQRVRTEVASLRQSLEDRKLIEQAKGVVMRRLRIEEAEAYHRMRRLSSQHNWKLVELGRRLLDSDAIFRMLEEVR